MGQAYQAKTYQILMVEVSKRCSLFISLLEDTSDYYLHRLDHGSALISAFFNVDGNEVLSNIAISKIPSKAGLDAKFKALERAENAYYQGKGQTKQQVIQMLPFYWYCSFEDKDELKLHVFIIITIFCKWMS